MPPGAGDQPPPGPARRAAARRSRSSTPWPRRHAAGRADPRRGAVPATVATDLGPFVAAAKPGLAQLGAALTKAIPAIRDATPLIDQLRNYLRGSLASTKLFAKLSSNLQQHGFVENFLRSPTTSRALSRGRHVAPALGLYRAANGSARRTRASRPGLLGHFGTTATPGKASARCARHAAAPSRRPRAAPPHDDRCTRLASRAPREPPAAATPRLAGRRPSGAAGAAVASDRPPSSTSSTT